MEVTVTSENFEAEVLNSDKLALVDFWATWCGPCRMLAPVIEELAKEYERRAKICKVNVDEQPELAARFGIVSIPTVMAFRNGEVVDTLVGLRPRDNYESILESEE